MPKVGEIWRTRVGPYRVRIIADSAAGSYPLVGLIEMGNSDLAWNFGPNGGTRDPYDNGFDLVELVATAEPQPNIAQANWDEYLKACSP